MTHTPAPMTADRIAKIRADYCMTDEWCLEHPDYAAEVRLWRELFAHIDAQAARIAELEREVQTAETRREAAQWAADNNAGMTRANAAEARALTARAEALEEAAKFVELLKLSPLYGRPTVDEFVSRANEIAAAIRVIAQPKVTP